MIKGRVNADLEAVISLEIGWSDSRISLSAVVDTGFSEFLTLPGAIINALSLPYYDTALVRLANGAIESVEVFQAFCDWEGERRSIYVQSADGDVLCGMRLFKGHTLSVQVNEGGEVILE